MKGSMTNHLTLIVPILIFLLTWPLPGDNCTASVPKSKPPRKKHLKLPPFLSYPPLPGGKKVWRKHRKLTTQINTLLTLISSTKQTQQKDLIYMKLAKTYQQKSQLYKTQAFQQHNNLMEKWDQDPRKCPRPPRPNHAKSNKYYYQMLGIYRQLAQRASSSTIAAKALFRLSQIHIANGYSYRGINTLKRLIKRWPKHVLMPKAQNALSQIYFQKNQISKAAVGFRTAAASAQKLIGDTRTTTKQKRRLRGLYLNALYMQAWCDYNQGMYQNSFNRLQKVIQLSRKYAQGNLSKVSLENEALRDMTRVALKLPLSAVQFFKNIRGWKNATFAYQATKYLARGYQSGRNHPMAIQTYSFLMGRNIKGQKSQKGKEAPNFQSAILSNAAQLYHPKGVLKEAQRLIAFFSTSHPWNQRWHKLSFVYRAAQNNAGSSLLRSAAHLQDIARRHIKSKRRNYLRIASKLRQMQRTHFPAAKP